ncbi:MAG: CHAT domain-containing protein [Timaviella obliquedivisa GSE-PSE-MK23-08B]|jgi:CHAT domain-containing protein/tetratricopeptide (TPR) repeat protein|nr:CHAT domain-containing protein [Timaviella obliquedivisa GSE-PSE-MK23-08B]
MFKFLKQFSVRHSLKFLFLSTLALCIGFSQPVFSQRSPAQLSPARQVQQGVDRYHRSDFQAAIAAWEQALTRYQSANDLPNTAIVLENLARTHQTIGHISKAITKWEQVISTYRQLGNLQKVGQKLTEQAQAYTQLGQYRQAITLLCGSVEGEATCQPESTLLIARTTTDPLGEVAALGSLGEAHRLTGEYEVAIAYLKSAAVIANGLENSAYQTTVFSSLGSTYANLAQVSYRRAISAQQTGDTEAANRFKQKGLADDQRALEAFQQSEKLAVQQNDIAKTLQVLLNTIPSAYRTGSNTTAIAKTQQAIALIPQIPDSQNKVYRLIDLAHLFTPISANQMTSWLQCSESTTRPQTLSLLQQALTVAQHISDRRSLSFALGELGHFYECSQDLRKATLLTQQAREAAEQEPDSRYLWEWQAGRVLKSEKQAESAISAYENSIATLKSIRQGIVSAKRDIQFDFRDTIEPIYRELIELRLDQEQPSTLISATGSDRNNLDAATTQLDSLKLVELQNYFGDDCVLIAVNESVETIDTHAAIFSSIILNNRTAILVKFPDGTQQYEWVKDAQGQVINREILTQTLNEYRRGVENRFDAAVGYDTQQAQDIYDWIIRPFVKKLEETQPQTLVFVQDGILRSVPMAALHNGSQFLIERYAIATTASLTLTNPRPFQRQGLRALALGLTQSAEVGGQKFGALTNVEAETQNIERILPGSRRLLDLEFTSKTLEKELDRSNYPIIHIATHGQFGNEPNDTFLVTGDKKKLTINILDDILRSVNVESPIELLSLTACTTAVGDDRAALGLAGVAAQAGAKSVLASLWLIEDNTTAKLVDSFYSSLREEASQLSKAEALQRAQLSILKERPHPAYWAAFTLIGNWQ